MNILYVAPDIPIPQSDMFVGGSTHVLEISRCLTKLGNKVIILARRNKGQKEYEVIEDNIVVYRVYRGLLFPLQGSISSKIPSGSEKKINILPSLIKFYFSVIYRPILIINAIEITIREEVDVVLDRNSSFGIGIFAACLRGIPSFAEVIDPNYSDLALKLSRGIFAYTSKIFPNSLQNKIIITTAGVDTDKFNTIPTSNIRKLYNLDNKQVLCYVGENSAWHGIEDIVSLSKKLPSNIKILLIGKNLENYISDNIICPGFVPHNEVKNYILASDICLAPYNPSGVSFMKEGFCFSPIKIFEYMACGKPIVAPNIDIIRNIISDNRCGILYIPGDIEDFHRVITFLLNNQELSDKLSANSLKASEKYTWNKVAEQINIALNTKK